MAERPTETNLSIQNSLMQNIRINEDVQFVETQHTYLGEMLPPYHKTEPWYTPECPYVSQSGSKRDRRKSQILFQQQQTYRQRMAAAKERRSARASRLKGVHSQVMDMVAYYFNVQPSFIEEGVLDFDYHIDMFDSLFASGGRQALMFCCMELPTPGMECGRFQQLPKTKTMLRAIIVDPVHGKELKVYGLCVIVYRTSSNYDAEAKHLYEDYCYTSITVDDNNKSVMAGLSNLLESLTCRVLQANTNWGVLNKKVNGQAKIDKFMCDFQGFSSYVKNNPTKIRHVLKDLVIMLVMECHHNMKPEIVGTSLKALLQKSMKYGGVATPA